MFRLAIILLLSLVYSGIIAKEYPYTIEKEEMHFRFLSGKTKYDNYMSVNKVEIECERKIKIITDEGASIWSAIVLPEPIDDLYKDILPKIRFNNFFLEKYSLDEVEIMVLRNDKYIRVETQEPNLITKQIITRDFPENQVARSGTIRFDSYSLPKLTKDDQILLKYKISIPYSENLSELASFRIFFHDSIPKRNVIYRVSKSPAAKAIFNYKNGAEPHSSFQSDFITDKWQYDNLPAALGETNAHPYADLPHIEVFTHSNNFNNCSLISDPSDATYGENQYLICSSRNYHFLANQQAIRIGSTYPKYKRLKTFVNEHSGDSNSTFTERVRTIFNHIANEFEYDADIKHFNNEIEFDMDFSNDLQSGLIRESNRLETYAAVLDQLGAPYVLLTPIDKRVGAISNQYIRPFYSGDQFFSVVTPSGQFLHILTKSRNCGYYVDELPFYFEDSDFAVTYSPFHGFNPKEVELTFGTRHRGWHLTRPVISAPKSSQTDNFRSTSMQCQLTLGDMTITHSGRMLLSGQFSTLTRGLYLCDETSPYVSEQYNTKVWDGIVKARQTESTVTETSTSFPFTTKVDFEFKSKPIQRLGRNQFELDLSGWIKHIDVDIDSTERVLDFYPDFKHADKYSVMILLDDSVTFVALPEDITIQNHLGSFQFRIKTQNNAVQIFSNLIITAEVITAEDIQIASELYSAIQRAENAKIVFEYRALD